MKKLDDEIDALKKKLNFLENRKKSIGKQMSSDELKILKKNLSNRIKKRRKELGLTKMYFAELSGTTRMTIDRIESGDSFPTLVNLINIAATLQCKISDLLNDDDIEAHSKGVHHEQT